MCRDERADGYPGTYEVVNNTVAFNMYADFSERDYALVAGYPDDDTGIPPAINLSLVNNIFAFNTGHTSGTDRRASTSAQRFILPKTTISSSVARMAKFKRILCPGRRRFSVGRRSWMEPGPS